MSSALIWVSVRPKTSKLPVLTSSQRIEPLFLMDRQLAKPNFSGTGLSVTSPDNKTRTSCLKDAFSQNITLCLDVNERDGFGSRSIIFTYMQADITPALNFVLSLMAVQKETKERLEDGLLSVTQWSNLGLTLNSHLCVGHNELDSSNNGRFVLD